MPERVRTPLMQAQRNANASAILRALLRSGPQGRKRLTTTTGISSTTVTKTVAELLDRQLIVETTTATRQGTGRPEVPLDLPGAELLVVGTHIHPDATSSGAFDLRGRRIAQRWRQHRSRTFTGIVNEAIALTERVLADVGGQRVIGIGYATGGAWPVGDGDGAAIGPNQWHMSEVQELFAGRLPLAFHADTNVRALSLSEHWWGRGDGDVLTVYVGRTIGVAEMEGDTLRRGRQSLGGSVDHLVVPGSEVPCECGQVGCLTVTCGDKALLAEAVAAGILPPGSLQSALYPDQSDDAAGLAVLRRRRADALARFLPGLIRFVEPVTTVIYGAIGSDAERTACLRSIRDRYHALTGLDLDLQHRNVPRDSWARASAAVALHHHLVTPLGVR